MVYVEFQLVYATSSKIGSQLLLTLASSKVLLGRGSEKAFDECLGVGNIFPSVAKVLIRVLSLIAAKQRYALNVLSNLRSFIFIKIALFQKYSISEFSTR